MDKFLKSGGLTKREALKPRFIVDMDPALSFEEKVKKIEMNPHYTEKQKISIIKELRSQIKNEILKQETMNAKKAEVIAREAN